MYDENVEGLANQLFYTGFGEIKKDDLEKALAEARKAGKDEFQMVLDKKYGKDSVKALLNFKISEKHPDTFFFNNFTLLLKKEEKEETLQQNFKVFYGNTYTLKEAYNLLDGRSVNKDFIKVDLENRENNQEYNAWAYIDFTSVDENGNHRIEKVFNYDLEKVIDSYNFKNMEYPSNRKRLEDGLKKGNLMSETLVSSRGEERVYIEAAPRFFDLKLYDDKMRPILLSVKKESVSQEQGQAVENNQNVDIPEAQVENKNPVENNQNAAVPDVQVGNSNAVENNQNGAVPDAQVENNNPVENKSEVDKSLNSKETLSDAPAKGKENSKQRKTGQTENKNKKQGARTRMR